MLFFIWKLIIKLEKICVYKLQIMKHYRTLLLTSIISLIFTSYAITQIATFNHVPLKFKNVDPLWIHIICDSTMIGAETDDSSATYDGHTHVKDSDEIEDDYIVYEDHLYLISRSLYDNDNSGAIIEKVNINSGELIWKTVFDGRTLDYREHIERTIIRNDKLVLYTYLITQADPESFTVPIVFLGWAEGVVKMREYDLDTGELVYESTPDISDPQVKEIRDYKFDVSQLHIINEDSLLLYKRYWDTIGSFFIVDTLSTFGKVLNEPDTTWSQLDIDDWEDSYWNSGWGIRQDDDELTYWLDFYTPGDSTLDTAQANINIYDKGVLVDNLSLGFIEKSNIRSWYLRDVTSDYIYIQVIYFNDQGTRHLFFTKQGELLESVYNPINRNFYVKLDQDQKFIIGDNAVRVGDNFEFSFYQNNEGTLSKISSMTIDIPNYRCEIGQVQKLDDGGYLVEGLYYEVIGFDYRGGTRFIMKLSEEMIMGETVSTTDVDESETELSLYPNPTTGILHLEFEKFKDTQVVIYDMQGMEVYSKNFFTARVDIDLSFIESGVYTIVVNVDGQLVRRKVIRI